MADEQQNPEEKPEESQQENLKQQANSLFSRIRSWILLLFQQIGPFFKTLLERLRKIDTESLRQSVGNFVKVNWQRLRSFRWDKKNLQEQAKKLKAKSDEFIQSESFQKQKARISSKAKKLGQKAQEVGAASTPILEKAKQQLEQTTDAIRRSPKEQTDETRKPLWENPSGLPSQVEVILLQLAQIPWMRRFMDWWSSRPIWRSDSLFSRYLLPSLTLICLALMVAGIFLFTYTRTNLSLTEKEIRVEASASLKKNIEQQYATYIIERSQELEQIVLDNITKADIIADAPTFQDLNIQKMEEFSRSLLRKDSNLLNVLVLTKDEVKQAIRTRRIGDTTRFLFTCCELPNSRRIDFDEINEPRWLAELSKESAGISEVYLSPRNGEKYFYHGSNIEDFKGAQTGGLLLRYNLNAAIRTLQKGFRTGVNFLMANDSLVVASSEDTLMPRIPVIGGDSLSKPIDYIIRVINLIRQSSSQEEALLTLRKGTFIAEPKAFESQFAAILPGEILASNEPAEDGNVYLLSEEQAQAILNLSFGQLLGLKNRSRNEGENVPTLSLEESQVLAMAYLDSMKQIGTGIIVDQGYLLSFATNQFGWLMVNQSTNEQYMAPIMAKNEFISDRFDSIKSRIFWFSLLSGLFFLGLFVLLTTGILYRFVRPINQLVEVVAETRREAGKAVEDIEEDATFEFLGESFAELSQDLKTYINKLELSNQELEQYAHVIAHDLREPLRMVSSYVGLLARRHKDDFDEASDEYVHYAIQGTKRMDQMIRDVLDYATLNQKLNAVEKEVVDLNQSVEQAVEMLQNKIEDSGAGIKIEPLPKVMGKASYLTLVFQNLIENAIKYRLPEVAPEIEVSARQEEAEWILTIKDNGRGFPEEALEQIFEMFKRWNEPKNEESSGIGLATCVRIMADHGGRVWADSPGEGRGANFYLSFPASPNE